MRSKRFKFQLKHALIHRLTSFALLHLILILITAIVAFVIILVDRDSLRSVISVVPFIFSIVFMPIYLLISEAALKGQEFYLFIYNQQTRRKFIGISALAQLAHLMASVAEATLLPVVFSPLIRQGLVNQDEFDAMDREIFSMFMEPSAFHIAMIAIAWIAASILGRLLTNVGIYKPKSFTVLWIVIAALIWGGILAPDIIPSNWFSPVVTYISSLSEGISLLFAVGITIILTLIELIWTRRLSVAV